MSKLFSPITSRIGRWFSSALLWLYLLLSDSTPPHQPGRVRLLIYTKGEKQMKFFVLDLPPVLPDDLVAKRVLQLSINAEPLAPMNLPAQAIVSPEIAADHDMVLTGTLVDVDAAGNKSLPSEFRFVIDVTAPHQPGVVGLRMIDKPDEPTTTPEPEVTTTPEPAATTEEPQPTSTEQPATTAEPVSTSDESVSTSEEAVSTTEEPTTSEEIVDVDDSPIPEDQV